MSVPAVQPTAGDRGCLALPLPGNVGDASIGAAVEPVALGAYRLRCWARAYLVEQGMMPLQEAVDVLQELAVDAGLVDLLGQDAVQSIMAKAFEWRDGTC